MAITCLIPVLQADIPKEERDVLIAFYEATNGDAWHNNTFWLGPPGSERYWYGVTVNG